MKACLKTVTLLLALVFCCCLLPAPAAKAAGSEPAVLGSGKCGDNVTWKLTDDGVFTVSGTGEMYDYDSPYTDSAHEVIHGYSPWHSFYDENDRCTIVNTVIVEDGVTKIGAHSFHEFRKLKNVFIGSGVTIIEEGAFKKCTSLKRLTIPDNVKILGQAALSSCSALENLELSKNLTEIRDFAFSGCKKITKLTIPAGEAGDLKLGQYLVKNTDALEEVEIFRSVKELNIDTFTNAPSLKKIVLPAVQKINNRFVTGCPALTDIYYPGNKTAWNNALYSNVSWAESTLGNIKIHTYHLYDRIYNCRVKTQYETYGYTGKAIKPKVEVRTCSGTKLTEGTHYNVRYANNKDYGKGNVIVTGIGKYSGVLLVDFNIVPAKPKDLKVVKIEKQRSAGDEYSVTISWKPVLNAAKYEITFFGKPKGETTDTTFTVKDLGWEPYSIGVRAVVDLTDPETGEVKSIVGNRKIIQVPRPA